MSSEDIKQKISEYSSFIQTTLQPNLEQFETSFKKAKIEIGEYDELRTQLQGIIDGRPSKRETIVDLGYKTIFCEAVVDDYDTIFVHVGMGFHIEMRISEALEFVDKRIKFLTQQVLSPRDQKVKETKAHIESATEILRQLQIELNRSK